MHNPFFRKIAGCVLSTVLLAQTAIGQQKHPNVLMICLDDMRPDLGCYGDPVAHSPQLDAFSRTATIFKKQFVAVPTCGASRAVLLTGKLPRSAADLSNEAGVTRIMNRPASDHSPETFIAYLKNSGYYTVGIGKISHYVDGYVYPYDSLRSNQLELPGSWNEMLFDAGKWKTGWNAFFGYADGSNRQSHDGEVKPYEKADVPDEGYPDGLTANLAVSKIKELAKKGQPFFLGVGFFKPHLPFTAPAKYWDEIDENKIGLTPSPDIPQHVNKASLHGSVEFNQYNQGEEKASLDRSLSDAYARKLKHAYYACIAYTDAQVGKVLQALHEQGLDENTIVVIWSDHGWHLGDDRVWGKHTLFQRSLRSILMIRQPGGQGGQECGQVVSSADLYPTITELCYLNGAPKTDGQSLVPLLKNPSDQTWRNTAYSYYNKGISLFTTRYHLLKYFREAEPVIELYDVQNDPYENDNIAAQNPKIVQQLLPLLEKGNTGLYGAAKN